MELTKEQYDIINSEGNIKINAVAGSGKTTTIIEYANARPKTSKILYLAFNKSVKLEATKKFAEKGLYNVDVETAHSLAYKYIVSNSDYKLKAQGYKTHEIVELLKLVGNGEKHSEYILANHINKFVAYFCNSNKSSVQELNYLDVVSDKKAKSFVSIHYKFIERKTSLLLGKMENGEIEITHDFYLKKFQLSNPQLIFDYILFDEGQDASPAMLDIFLKQKAIKVIVGDTHQQIYGWRYAINSLEKTEFKTYNLSTSFRFSQDIANLAIEILKWKNHINEHESFLITGKGTSKEMQVKAVLARTNLGLLVKAIEYVTEKKKVKHLYFEGNINSYTYADEGASLFDVLNLYNGKNWLVKDKLIKAMNSLEELNDYIETTEDVQLGILVEIVNKYGNEIPNILNAIKEKHVDNEHKEKAEMIFSTVHRCKGMEYDTIQIVNDFITEEKLEQFKSSKKKEDNELAKLNEEINLLYVAVTRAKNNIYIPETLIPKDFPKSVQVHKIKIKPKEDERKPENDKEVNKIIEQIQPSKISDKKTYTFDEVRTKHKDAYKSWTKQYDDELMIMYCEGVKINDLAKHFGRTRGAIKSRIKKLELEELYEK